MNRFVAITFVCLTSVMLSGCSLIKTTPSGIQVLSNIPASVTIDGQKAGDAPFESTTYKASKHTILITPSDNTYPKRETALTLRPGFVTQLDWTFGKTDAESSGIAFEYEDAKKSDGVELQLVATPDNIPVSVDGKSVGMTPLLLEGLSPQTHSILFQAPGYAAIERSIQLVKGTRVLVTAKLARLPLPSPTPLPTPASASATPVPQSGTSSDDAILTKSTTSKPYVKILNTPTDFLRVRADAAASAAELARLSVGSSVPYAGASASGWLKVTYDTGKTGWVSGQFATLVQ